MDILSPIALYTPPPPPSNPIPYPPLYSLRISNTYWMEFMNPVGGMGVGEGTVGGREGYLGVWRVKG